MARHRGNSGHVKKIENLIWQNSQGANLAQSAGSVAAIAFATVGTLPVTLLRLRGEFLSWLDAAGAPGEVVQVNAGIIFVPEGTATTVVYSPQSDANAPWLWYAAFTLGREEQVVDVIALEALAMKRIEIDNKVMRRIRLDVEVQFVIETVNVSGSPASNHAFNIRWFEGF